MQVWFYNRITIPWATTLGTTALIYQQSLCLLLNRAITGTNIYPLLYLFLLDHYLSGTVNSMGRIITYIDG